ncbi:MAG: LytR/AlgR family response regulator transcription factor, partial [Nitrospinota bacterium]
MAEPLKALIVDDEKLARDELRYHLEALGEKVEVVGEARDGLSALDLVHKLRPDLVFLDVQMPGMDGFGVVERLLEEGEAPAIVFVTAYDEYAIRAFEVNAVDYLLKPIDGERLKGALSRVSRLVAPALTRAELEKLLEGRGRGYISRVTARRRDKLLLIDARDALYFRAEGGIVTVKTREGAFDTNYRTLDELEGELDPKEFFRAHRGYLVNLREVAEIIPHFGGTYRLKLKGADEEVPLSRAQAKRLRRVF